VGEAQPVAENGSGRSGRPIDEIFPREAFDVASAAELKRCRRFERSFSLLLLDAGVEVDRRAGRILLSNLREFDLVGRYGDDVFAIGLPETSAEGARVIAQRLVGLLARRGAWSDRGRLGFATYPRDGNTLTTVVRSARADLSDGAPA
jgi:GGDEF domain-containing protein